MAISDTDILEVIYRYTVNNQICMAVFHYTSAQGYANADPVQAAANLAAKLAIPATNPLLQNMAAAQAQTVSYLDVQCQVIYPQRWLATRVDCSVIGAHQDSCRTQNISAVITKITKFAARSGVGSFHLGGLPSAGYANGLLNSDTRSELNFIGSAMLLNVSENGQNTEWEPALLNKEKIPNTFPQKYRIKGSTNLFSYKTQPEVRVMRRRTVGLGI